MYFSSTVVESQRRQLVTYITRRFVVSRNTCRLVDHTRGTHAKKINKGRRRNSYIYIYIYRHDIYIPRAIHPCNSLEQISSTLRIYSSLAVLSRHVRAHYLRYLCYYAVLILLCAFVAPTSSTSQSTKGGPKTRRVVAPNRQLVELV